MATLIIRKENARPSVGRQEQDRIRRRLDQDLKNAQRQDLVPEILLSCHLPLPGRGTVLPGLGLFPSLLSLRRQLGEVHARTAPLS